MDLTDRRRASGMTPRHGQLASYADIGTLVPLLLLYEGLAFEWNLNIERLEPLRSHFPLVYSYVNPALFFLVPFLLILSRPNLRGSLAEQKYVQIVWCSAIVMAAILVAQQIVRPLEMTKPNMSAYVVFFAWPLWIRVGMWIGNDDLRTEKLLRRLARLAMAASLFSFSLRVLHFSVDDIIGPMYWPYSMIVMFGFFYYLAQGIVGAGGRMRPACGLACCSLEVLGSFSKKFVFGVGVGMIVFTAAVVLLGARKHVRILQSVMGRVATLVVLLFGAIAIWAGQILAYLNSAVQTSWLRNPNSSASDLVGLDASMVETLASGRFDMWREIWPRFQSSPWIGAGLSPFYRDNIVSHNGFFDVLLSVGLLGAGACVAGALMWILAIWRSNVPRHILVLQLACVSFIGGILGLNVGISVWLMFNTVNAYFFLLVGVSLGLALQTRRS